jgi:hypothetical protein
MRIFLPSEFCRVGYACAFDECTSMTLTSKTKATAPKILN